MDILTSVLTNLAQGIASEVQGGDFVKTLTAILFWVGGYAAAPVLFIATMGVFRNLAGMGTSSFKKLSGGIKGRTGARLAAGKEVKQEGRDRKRRFAVQRGQYNQRKRREAGFRASLRGEAETVDRPSRADWREANTGILGAQLAQSSPSIVSGSAVLKAAQAETEAQTVQAQLGYEKEANRPVPGRAPAQARDDALNKVLADLVASLDKGEASNGQVAGTMNFLAQQKAGTQLNTLHDHIATMTPGEEANKASRQWANALGTQAYPALMKVNPAYTKTPHTGMVNPVQERATANFAETNEKLMEAAGATWEDMFEADAAKAAQRFADIHKMGGEAAAKLAAPKKAPATGWSPAKQTAFNDFLNDLQTTHGIDWKAP